MPTKSGAKTAREWLAEQTNTQPEDWYEIPTRTKAYEQGYRYENKTTGQRARRPQPEKGHVL